MKIRNLFILAFLLCTTYLLISSLFLQSGDDDFSILITVTIYFIPIFFLSGLNALFLTYILSKTQSKKLNIIASFIPVLILITFLFLKDSVLYVVGFFGTIPFLITNIIWVWKLKSPENKTS